MNSDTKEYIDNMLNRYNFMSDRGIIEVGDETHVLTDINIIKGMYDLLGDDFWKDKDSTILDISCKSAGFLVEAYRRFMIGLEGEIPNVRERHANILINQLWGIPTCQVLAYTTRRILYSKWDLKGNIFEIANHKGLGRRGSKALSKEIDERSLRDMQFDVVVGNPPYNKGMDIDFVNLGFDLCTKYCLMITPAKWQTAEANQRIASKMSYGEFRKKIVPHMTEVVFYPNCVDVFDIQQRDGITYYLIDRQNKHEKCNIENKCINQKLFNGKKYRAITDGETLNNIGNDIIEIIHGKKFSFNQVDTGKEWQVIADDVIRNERGQEGVYQAKGVIGYKTGKMSVTGNLEVVKKGTENIKTYTRFIFESNDKNECDSFISWVSTKFVRFLISINISKRNDIYSNHYFRFVPAPPPTASGNPWDHVYTDEELYKYFKLPQEYIDVIEAVIKERK